MSILVDTCVWSLGFRRKRVDLSPAQLAASDELYRLMDRDEAVMMGCIRQELLSGIRDTAQFNWVKDDVYDYQDIQPHKDDYIKAASFKNQCASRGIVGSPIDLLICAVAERDSLPIFTIDKDFKRFAEFLPIVLHRW